MNLNNSTVVVIDDFKSIRKFLCTSLKAEYEGIKLYDAETAMEGIDICKKVQPDLVVLDLGLPDLDGLEIIPEIKKNSLKNRIYIIVLTVRKGKEIVTKVYEKGADAYLSKPFIIDDLLEIIEENLN